MPHSLTEGCADVNGARLRYTIFPGPGELLVLHHGWQASQDTWTAFASVVSRKYSVLTFDCRGAGRSGSPPGRSFTIAQLSGDLIGLVDVLFGPAQRFHVAAHSMGGLVGLQLLTSLTSLEKSGRRGRLLSVMLVAPAPFTGIRVSPDYTASTHSAWRLARTDPSAFDALVEETAATQLPLVEGEQDRKAHLGHARRFCAINMRARKITKSGCGRRCVISASTLVPSLWTALPCSSWRAVQTRTFHSTSLTTCWYASDSPSPCTALHRAATVSLGTSHYSSRRPGCSSRRGGRSRGGRSVRRAQRQ